ncbi:acyltransferase family protein [Kineococcus sp. LSe6-4]|uniref:Acyltransferase family protein n=1 Tax=Kineococcus halophytocola TaxID=3234027 RepID=A0ABV4H2X3_9ACTN
MTTRTNPTPPAGTSAGRARRHAGRPRVPAAPRGAAARGRTLAAAFDSRHNALDVLRLALALTVAVVHTMYLGLGHQPQAGSTDVGSLAVDGFFVLSGFLVARSWLRLGSLRRFLWHRALRILPAFYVSLALTALVVAPLLAVLSGRSATSVFSGPDSAVGYVTRNAGLLMRQFGIAGLGDDGSGSVVNGSLWTLFFEAACYGIVAGLGVLGVLARRRWVVPALLVLLWALTVSATAGYNPVGSELMLRFAFIFLLGVAGHLYADRLPLSLPLAALAVALVAAGLALLPDYRALGGPAFAYAFLYAVVRLPLRWRPRWDLSYGVYVWHWPIALTLATAGLAGAVGPVFVPLSLAVTAVVAALSWRVVEAPALSLKNAAWVTAGRVRRP